MSKEFEVIPCRRKSVAWALLLALLMFATAAMAQTEARAPKAEIFGGYSWFSPGGDVDQIVAAPAPPATPTPTNTPVGVNSFNLPPVSNAVILGPGQALATTRAHELAKGYGLAGTINFGKVLGFTFDHSGHYQDTLNVQTLFGGIQAKFRTPEIEPFVHVMAGGVRIAPQDVETQWHPALAVGGGFDVLLNRRLMIRVVQADYIYTNYDQNAAPAQSSRWNSARVQSGLVLRLGLGEPAVPPSASCSVQPSSVLAGEPVTATATPSNFNPKRTLTYTWSATGGKISGTTQTANVDTTGLAPGNYSVKAAISDGKKGAADCTASFTINEPPKHPPTISCSVNPAQVISGDPATVSCQGVSPDGRPLTYTHTADAGKITPNGANATLDTTGVPKQNVSITSTVTDDRNLSASANTSVAVDVPPPPPTSSKLNEITFPDTKKPARVDNTAKAILDDVALRLQREPDAKAVVIGFATADETKKKTNRNLAAQRAINTKAYLTQEKGIDPSRIEVRSSAADANKAEIWIVPAGASFAGEGTTVVDESKLSAQPRVAPPARVVKKKPAPAQ